LFPGGMASSWVYRDGVKSVCGVNVMPIAIVTVMGGVAGSILLLLTPSRIFDGILPWLLLVATLMLAAGPRLSAQLQTQARSSVLAFATVQFFLGLYGGYFGGAVGLMMLAAWSALGGGDIKSLNPTRMVMVTAANAVAVVVFVLAGAIVWQECIPMTGPIRSAAHREPMWFARATRCRLSPRSHRPKHFVNTAKHYFGRIDFGVILNLMRQCGHRCGGWWFESAAMTARRIAGSVGLGGPRLFLFFPLCLV
jgi:hypothetical protein